MEKKMIIKNSFCLVAALFFFTQLIWAQQSIDSSNAIGLINLVKFTVSWHNGLEWEKKIGKASVINFFGGIGIGLASDDFLDYKAPFIISPNIFVEYRNYYNLLGRINKQKKTKNNSANFLFGRVEGIFAVKNQNDFNLLFIQGWGLQRSLCKKILLTYHLGLIEHFYFDKPPDGGFNYLKLEPLGELSISYVF